MNSLLSVLMKGATRSLLTLSFLLLNQIYKMYIISLSKAFFFSFLWEPLSSLTLEFSPSKTWKSCQSTGALWVLSPAALNPAFSVSFSLTHTHTYIHALAPSPLLPFFASLWKPSWEFRGSLPFSLFGFCSLHLSMSVSSNELWHAARNP